MRQQISALYDVFYEASQLHSVFNKYLSSGIQNSEQIIHDALLEKSLVHTRNLMDFFETTRDKALKATFPDLRITTDIDDVICEDFGEPPRILFVEADLRKRINKLVSHITYSRSLMNKTYKPYDVFPPVLRECSDFFEQIRIKKHALPAQLHPTAVDRFVDECIQYYG